MALRCCVLLVCFAQEIFGCRNRSMSLILLYWWIISELGDANCISNYSFNLCFFVVEISFTYIPLWSFLRYHSLLSCPKWWLSHMTFSPSACFPPISCLFATQSRFSSQLSPHLSRALALCLSSYLHWGRNPLPALSSEQLPGQLLCCLRAPVHPHFAACYAQADCRRPALL